MTKTELENKHIAELHTLAAEAGVERYRMLPRGELIAKLAGADSGSSAPPSRERSSGRQSPAGERDRACAAQSARPSGDDGDVACHAGSGIVQRTRFAPHASPAPRVSPSTPPRPRRRPRRPRQPRPLPVSLPPVPNVAAAVASAAAARRA